MEDKDAGQEGFRMLDPAAKKAMYMKNAISAAVSAALAAAALYLCRDYPWHGPASAALLAALAVFIAYEAASPSVFFRYYRYRIDEDCIEVRRGVIIRTHTMVPVERIHQVNLKKGPILRRYGLMNVVVTTAGGTAAIEYLGEETAYRIAGSLNEKIIAMLKARQ